MKKNKCCKSFKLVASIVLLAEALAMMVVVIVLSIQKKSIPKAVLAVLAAGGVLSALLLISNGKDAARRKRIREMDAFYDYDYEMAYNGVDDCGCCCEDDDYELDLEESDLIPGVNGDE